MASKKEYKRKQKNKQNKPAQQAPEAPSRPSFIIPGTEINSLDLLSAVHGVPKATEAGANGKKASKPAAESMSGPDPDAERQEEAERAAAEVERCRREAEEADAARQAAAEAEAKEREDERIRLEDERRRKDAQAEEQARQAAEETERRRREVEEAEQTRRQAEEAERREREARDAERCRPEEEAAKVREAEQTRRIAAAERAKRMAEEVEKARRMAEEVERVRRENEEAERKHAREVEEERVRAERVREEEAARIRANEMAEEAERVRRMQAEVERARIEAEEREREALAAFVPPAPPLEVDNPYWQKSPEIFDVLSGAPHGDPAPAYGENSAAEPALPVTMAEGLPEETHYGPGGSYEDAIDDVAAAPQGQGTAPVPQEKRMYIVMVTPEVAPCAKVGGLGDVILGLGRELMKRGHGVEVICPMYSGMRYDQIYDLHEEYAELWSPHYNEWRAEKVFQGRVEGGLQVNFITGGTYTERPSIYGYDDDLQRFTYFSRQALEFMFKTNRRPDIIHCHDWATGLVPAILWDIYEKLGWTNSRVVYTIHNNECQGLCGFSDKLLGLVGLDAKLYHRPDRMQDDTHPNCINMMKGGIVYSNFVTTVSPTYAGELKTAAGGRGLQTTITKNSAKIGGVLNGIDYDSWNPQTDPKLAVRYSVGEDFNNKYENKRALREWLGLWDAWKPIIAVVTRLTHQKGLDLIKHAIFRSQELQAQFVLLGSAPDPKVNSDFLALQHQLRDNHDVNLYIGYHEDLSRVIYAGSDLFLVPSLYEPCGLTQMISLRYGTVPIVRETGGLVDTVFDLDNSGRGLSEANGFTFRDPTPLSLDYGLERAVRLWYDNPEAFNRLARNGMKYDYSWRHPAEHYENIYNYIKA